MPNLQEMCSEDKTGKANAQIFLHVVRDKGSDVILFFFFHVMSKPERTASTVEKKTNLVFCVMLSDLITG